MTLTDVVENPKSIHSIFDTPPDLEGGTIRNLEFKEDGPTIHIGFRLTSFPSRPPERWLRMSANAAILELKFFVVTNVSLQGWDTENPVSVDIRRCTSGNQVVIAGPTVKLSLTCGWIYVVKLEGYQRDTA